MEQNEREEEELAEQAKKVEKTKPPSSDSGKKVSKAQPATNLVKRPAQQPTTPTASSLIEPPKVVAKEPISVVSIRDAVKSSPYLDEFISVTVELRVKKRELKATEKKMLILQKQFLGLEDPTEENE